jgi:hypothetical protein
MVIYFLTGKKPEGASDIPSKGSIARAEFDDRKLSALAFPGGFNPF